MTQTRVAIELNNNRLDLCLLACSGAIKLPLSSAQRDAHGIKTSSAWAFLASLVLLNMESLIFACFGLRKLTPFSDIADPPKGDAEQTNQVKIKTLIQANFGLSMQNNRWEICV